MKPLFALLLSTSLLCAQGEKDLLSKGDAFDARNQNREALAVFLEMDARNPNDAEILHRLSKQYAQIMLDAKSAAERKELGQKALDAAQRAVQADGRNAKAHLALAIVYGRLAQSESARRKVELSKLIRDEAEIATQLDPREDYAWHVLGRWNYELANFNPFLKGLAQVIYGKFPDASNEQAVVCLGKAASLRPDRVIHHIEFGRALLAVGKKQEAKEALEKGLALPSVAKDDNETKQRGRQALQQL